jgi:hypothetical protein
MMGTERGKKKKKDTHTHNVHYDKFMIFRKGNCTLNYMTMNILLQVGLAKLLLERQQHVNIDHNEHFAASNTPLWGQTKVNVSTDYKFLYRIQHHFHWEMLFGGTNTSHTLKLHYK